MFCGPLCPLVLLEGPTELLLAKVKNASGRIGILYFHFGLDNGTLPNIGLNKPSAAPGVAHGGLASRANDGNTYILKYIPVG